jgi:hypothetical protein
MASAKSFRLEMLQVARLAPKVLGESAALVEKFLHGKLTPAGGFADRQGRPDLYYTVFGIEGLMALRAEVPAERIACWVRSFGDGAGQDFVHLCSLARCAAGLGGDVLPDQHREALARRIEAFRAPDGGYHGTPGKARGSAYGALLAWGGYADLGLAMPDAGRLGASVQSLRLRDGSFANEPGLPQGTTTATAAAVTLCRHLGLPLPVETGGRRVAPRSGGEARAPAR